jgi:hypothetical protein
MSGGALSQHYHLLTPDERFRLVVEAKARGDTTEEDRLIAACPKVSATVNEPAFFQRWLTAEELVKAFVADTARFFGWLDLLDLLSEPVERAFYASWPDPRGEVADDDEPPERDEAPAEEADGEEDDGHETERETVGYPLVAMEAAHNAALAIIGARWEAFRACCVEDLGVDAVALLRAIWPQTLEAIETLPPGTGSFDVRHPERYEEARDEWREKAGEVWRAGIERY